MTTPRWYDPDIPGDTALYRLEMDRFLNQLSAAVDQRARCPEPDDTAPAENKIPRWRPGKGPIGGSGAGGGAGGGGLGGGGGTGSGGSASGSPQSALIEDDCYLGGTGIGIDDSDNLTGVVGVEFDQSTTSKPFDGNGIWYHSGDDTFYGETTGGQVDLGASGGVGGGTGAADNALLRADGTGGSTVQATGILVDDSDVMSSVTGIALTNQSSEPFGGTGTGLWVDNSDATARPAWAISGSEYGVPFVDLTGVSDGEYPAWNAAGNNWRFDAPSGLPASGGGYALVQRNSGDTAWTSSTQLDARHDPNSTSWGSPAHFIQNTDNQASAEYLPALELALPNHAYSGFVGGGGLSITGYGGTPMGAVSGKRTGSLSGDLYLGGTEGGSPTYTARCWANYSSTDGFAVEGDGMMGLKDVLSTDPNPTLLSGSDYCLLYPKDGVLQVRNVGADPFAIGAQPGADTTLATGTDQEADVNTVVPEHTETLPTSGTAAVTISGLHRTPGIMLDLIVKITTTIPTTGGITSVEVGDGSDQNRYAVMSTLTSGTQYDFEDWTIGTPPVAYTASESGDVVLTPIGGSWDAPAGVVKIYTNMTWLAIA